MKEVDFSKIKVRNSDGTYTDAVAFRGEKGPKGDTGSDASVTTGNITSALGYTPAKDGDVSDIKQTIANHNTAITNLQTGKADKTAMAETVGELTVKVIKAGFNGTKFAYDRLMKEWFSQQAGSPKTLTQLVNEWYGMTRMGWYGWTTFAQPEYSSVSTGVKGGDNAGLICVPSTDTVGNQDDYAGNPLFAVTTCNWVLDDNGKKVITAIKGIHDSFEQDNPDKYVGVMQQTAWVAFTDEEKTYTAHYADNQVDSRFKPLPEAIELDGTVNNFVLHGKYMAGVTASGKMTCCSGVKPRRNISHNDLVTMSKVNGARYSGGSAVDWSFIVWMSYIKYASLTQDGLNQGCVNYSAQYYAKVSETGVKRILINASNIIDVGSTVLIGSYAGSADRGNAGVYSISGQDGAVVLSVESVTVNGTAYSAIYVDCDAFDTVANGDATTGSTIVSTYHWRCGANDCVLGNDGAAKSTSDSKHAAMIQGIEYSVGGYEIFGDVILYEDETGEYYRPYIVRDAVKQRSGATVTTDGYCDTGLTTNKPTSAGWCWIENMKYSGEIFFAGGTSNGSSYKYTKDAFYKDLISTKSAYREWLAFGYMDGGSTAGLSCLSGSTGLGNRSWSFIARLSCNGNRGEFTAQQ